MSKIVDLKERRGAIVKEMRSLLDLASDEKRDLNADEQSKYDAMEKDVDRIGNQINEMERLDRLDDELSQQRDSNYSPGLNTEENKTGRSGKEYRNSFFDGYARRGKNGMDARHYNALEAGTDSEGGYIVPEEFETQVVRLLDLGNPIRAAANVIRTGSDRNVPIETDDGSFAFIAEEGSYTEDDPAFGRVILGAHKAGGIIKVSEELLQDSFFDLSAYMMDLAARRFNNLEDDSYGNGNGSGKPTGLFQTSTVGGVSVTGTTGGTSASPAITGDDLLDTFHGLKRSYRGNATWVTSDAMAKMIRKLKDNDDQYLWQPGLTEGQPDRILGRPVIITEGAPAIAVSTKSIIFADLSQYYIVERMGMTMQRLNELYAGNGQIGFRFMKRIDGKMVDPKAITFFQHGAAA